jgi:hypothetical protein
MERLQTAAIEIFLVIEAWPSDEKEIAAVTCQDPNDLAHFVEAGEVLHYVVTDSEFAPQVYGSQCCHIHADDVPASIKILSNRVGIGVETKPLVPS